MRIRITFAKQGALRYTGHLDLQKLWERTARRAGLLLAYSHGFHPQPKINLASALPLGFSSRAEVLDMWLEGEIPLEGIYAHLQASLPSGIQVLNVGSVEERAPALQTQVISAEYEVTLTEPIDGSVLKRNIDSLLKSETLPRQRRGKGYDLRPLIEELSLTYGSSPVGREKDARVFMRLSARESATGRPEEVLDVLGISAETTRIERTRLIFQ